MAEHESSLIEPAAVAAIPGVQVRQGSKALINNSGRVLLVKEHHSDCSPFWTFPGGRVEFHESRTEGLNREIAEELNCQVEIADQVGDFLYAHMSRSGVVSHYVVFEAEISSGPTANPAEGILEYSWVHPSALPPETIPQIRYGLKNHWVD